MDTRKRVTLDSLAMWSDTAATNRPYAVFIDGLQVAAFPTLSEATFHAETLTAGGMDQINAARDQAIERMAFASRAR